MLYNAALQARVDAYRKAGKSIRFFDQCKSLTQIRTDDPAGYGALPANLGRGTLAVLDRAMQSFFRRVKSGDTAGFPRFRSMSKPDMGIDIGIESFLTTSEGEQLAPSTLTAIALLSVDAYNVACLANKKALLVDAALANV